MNIKGMIIDRKVETGTDGKSKQAGFALVTAALHKSTRSCVS